MNEHLDQQAAPKGHDAVNHPAHYTSSPSGIECIAVTRRLSFNCGNAVKYLWRAGDKDPSKEIEDLLKAAWYIGDELAHAVVVAIPASHEWKRAVAFFAYNRDRAIEAICCGHLQAALGHIDAELYRLRSLAPVPAGDGD